MLLYSALCQSYGGKSSCSAPQPVALTAPRGAEGPRSSLAAVVQSCQPQPHAAPVAWSRAVSQMPGTALQDRRGAWPGHGSAIPGCLSSVLSRTCQGCVVLLCSLTSGTGGSPGHQSQTLQEGKEIQGQHLHCCGMHREHRVL